VLACVPEETLPVHLNVDNLVNVELSGMFRFVNQNAHY